MWVSRAMGVWTQPQTAVFGSGEAFFDWLEDESWGLRRKYLYAQNAADVLTLSGLWTRLSSSGCTWKSAAGKSVSAADTSGGDGRYHMLSRVTSLRTTIVDYERFGRRYTWTSLAQYLPMSEEEIATMIGFKWEDADDRQSEGHKPIRTVHDRCKLCLSAMQYIADWWKANNGGVWGLSLGSLSFQWLRHRLLTREVCTHRQVEALRLERHACYGGRVSCWYVGDVRPRIVTGGRPADGPPASSDLPIDGPVYSVDVRSMYASLMAHCTFPVKLIGHEPRMSMSDARDILRTCGLIASVQLVTDEAEYPYRSNDNVYYPTGRFTAVLAGPELCNALDCGHVASIGSVAIYQMGTPLHHGAAGLLAIRDNTSGVSGKLNGAFAKLIANASTGKLAQRQATWQPCPGSHPQRDTSGRPILWGDWLVSSADRAGQAGRDVRRGVERLGETELRPRTITRYRAMAGMVERHSRAEVGTGTLQAIYAYLTAYGRAQMRGIRRGMPDRSVLMQDTDGMWVTEDGYRYLIETGGLGTNLPGCLRLDRSIRHARIYGPKHYWADGLWTLSGMRDVDYDVDDQAWEYSVTVNAIRGCPREAPSEVVEYRRRCELLLIAPHGTVAPDGWITPYRLPAPVRRSPATTEG